MRRGNSDSRLYSDWIEYSEKDIAAAKLLVSDGKTALYAFFHCHQAIEKVLKAYFLWKNGYAPDGHNLVYFCRRAVESSPALRDYIGHCADINSAYIQARYPSDFSDDFDEAELPGDIEKTEELFGVVTTIIRTGKKHKLLKK